MLEFYGEKLKDIRKRLKITSDELSQKLGIFRSTLSAWENGKRTPAEAKIRMIAKSLGISSDKISNLKSEKPITKTDFSESVEALNSISKVKHNDHSKRIETLVSGINFIDHELKNAKVIINALSKALTSIVYIKDVNQKYVMVNELFLTNLSLRKNFEIFGVTDKDLFPEDEAKANDKEDRHVITTGESVVNREGLIPGSRKKKWGLISKTPIIDLEGRIEGVVGSFVDISERRKNEELRMELEEKLNSSNYGFVVYDYAKLKYVYVSKSVEQLTGYSPKAYFTKGFWYNKIVHPDDKHILEPYLWGKTIINEKMKFTYRIIKPDGTVRLHQTTAYPGHSEDGEDYILTFTEDITDKTGKTKKIKASHKKVASS